MRIGPVNQPPPPHAHPLLSCARSSSLTPQNAWTRSLLERLLMDFHVPAPGGVARGKLAALAAHGADPARIDTSPKTRAHFFRQVQSAPLQPAPGARMPLPQLLSMSFVEAVLGPAVLTGGNTAVGTTTQETTSFSSLRINSPSKVGSPASTNYPLDTTHSETV